ncbi:MAG: AarF/ABC1/UbiB kinase family protein [Alicyclobacillaceae bacterium]|nr:AarF/ABC1/UbiB kinase family protein [Alicyclobacillaceae bacterium]
MVWTVTLGKRVRHLHRYREIAQILIRNGFGWFIAEIGLADVIALPRRLLADRRVPPELAASLYERIRVTLEELGPTFIKVGQVASLRADLFPAELVRQLAKLQDEVAPVPFAAIREQVEAELGQPLEEAFAAFDEVPIGSASIGQVHRAVLRTGEQVAVKVQRPHIEEQIQVDLEVLADIARLAERRLDWARHYQLSEVVDEFRRTLTAEVDYTVEARNAERIGRMFEHDDTVCIPAIHWDWTTPRVLVMEYVEGVKLNDLARLDEQGFDRKLLAARASHAVFTQLLIHGFFHADPHPGNLVALPGHRILFMDFGMVGRLTPEMKERLAALIVGLMRRNTDLILRALHRMGVVPPEVDERKLRRDVDELRDKYYDVPLSQVHLGEAVSDIFSVAYRHRIQIPPDLALVGKTLLTIEGVVETLDPEFRILDVAEPFGRRLLRERLDPRTWGRGALSAAFEAWEFFTDFPKQLQFLVREASRGRVRVQLEIPELRSVLTNLDRISNRLSFSLMLLAISIFVAGLMIASSLAKNAAKLWTAPVTDIGLAIGGLMVLLLIWSIVRSGRL